MKKHIAGFALFLGILATPAFTQAVALTTAQSTSLIAVVQSSPGTPASAFVNLITAFSNITVNQAASLITVVQASPSTPASAFVDLLTSFTADTPITQPATPATNQGVTQTTTQSTAPTSSNETSVHASSTAPTIISSTTTLSTTTTLSQSIGIVQDGFDVYNKGTLQGQGEWNSYTNGSNFVVVDTEAFSGTKAIYNQTKTDSVITKTGSLLADGKQAVYVKTASRTNWGIHSDGNAQVRVSKNPWASGSAIFAAVSFKSDGNVAYYDPVIDKYKNFATYDDGAWTLLEIEWRSSDKTARYRVNNGNWTDWHTFRNAYIFSGFDNVGLGFFLEGSSGGGIYFDSLQ